MTTKLEEKVKTNGPKLEIVYRNPNNHPKVGFIDSRTPDMFSLLERSVKKIVSDMEGFASGTITDLDFTVKMAKHSLHVVECIGEFPGFRKDFNQIAKTV